MPKPPLFNNFHILPLLFRDAILIAVMDLVTSIIAGFVIFTTFGGLAKKTGLKVSEVAKGGMEIDQFCD